MLGESMIGGFQLRLTPWNALVWRDKLIQRLAPFLWIACIWWLVKSLPHLPHTWTSLQNNSTSQSFPQIQLRPFLTTSRPTSCSFTHSQVLILRILSNKLLYAIFYLCLFLWKPTYEICYHEWPKKNALVKLRFGVQVTWQWELHHL